MKRELQLTKRLHTLHALEEAVTAMKSLAAHHFLLARRSLQAGRHYRSEIEALIRKFGFPIHPIVDAPAGILLLTSDLGLCADFNSRLSQHASEMPATFPKARYYVVGRRGCNALRKKTQDIYRNYFAPASVDGLAGSLRTVAEDVFTDYGQRNISRLIVVSARFEGAGRFSVSQTQVLPLHFPADGEPAILSPWQSPAHLLQVALREYLYIVLYELLLDSLAAEHGMRLVAAETARKWIRDSSQTVQRQLSAVRRENSTQEVLDIVAASRKMRSDAASLWL
jgi:F-type H+-transporting ATPase subunit gamma